jgi:type II secretory pathway component PulF
MALGVEAGLSLDRVVQLAVDATGSRELAGHVARIPRPQLRSQPLASTFSGSALVSPEMVAALRVAEETGDYTNTLKKLAELYEDGF